MIANLIRAGLILGLLEPIYEEETSKITLPYILNDLGPTTISKLIFEREVEDPQNNGILSGTPISLRNASMFTTSTGLVGLASNLIKPDDVIVQIEHFHALPKIKPTELSVTDMFEVRSGAILRSAGRRASPECDNVGRSDGNAIQLFLLIGLCLTVSAKHSENRVSKFEQKYCII
jgi:hypothetical protein